MKNIKLNKVYKLESNKGLLIDVNYNCVNYILGINEDSPKYIRKCLKKGKISDALNSYNKYINLSNRYRKKEVKDKYLEYAIQSMKIKYNFVGNYLVNLELDNYNYIIDFANNTIEKCQFVETYTDNFNNNDSETIEDTETENSNSVIKKIEKINLFSSDSNLTDDLKKIINFSVNNSEIVKPVLKLINSKTNNLIDGLISSTGIDYSLGSNTNFTEIVTEISKYMKIIEDLNNNDIAEIKSYCTDNFNFILSEIWNQMKKIINLLNQSSQNDDYELMITKYQNEINSLNINNSILNNSLLCDVVSIYISNLENKIISSYRSLIESNILEINILLQNFSKGDNQLLDKKIDEIIERNYIIYSLYFSDIFTKNDVSNIFSEFNKRIKFNTILNSLEKDAKGYLVTRINSFISETKKNKKNSNFDEFKYLIETRIKNFNNNEINTTQNIHFVMEENIFETSYHKYKKIINIECATIDSFIENIKEKYKEYILIKNKKDISILLKKFHEEIKFKISIINKIKSNNSN
jgi:hypothetical protein